MLYHLFTYIENNFSLPGAGLFQYITFRAGASILLSLLISMVFGHRLIEKLRTMQVKETVRDLGLKGEEQKKGTPTMGGLIILGAILIPTLLFADLTNIYIILMLVATVWMGIIGFIDDYIKVFRNNKKGLAGKFKVLGQVVLGLIIGTTVYFHDDIKIRKDYDSSYDTLIEQGFADKVTVFNEDGEPIERVDVKSPVTTIPFFKQAEFNYSSLLSFLGDNHAKWTWIIFIPIVIFIITAVSNGVNITDGLDGLATGTSAIAGFTLAILTYISGNVLFSNYLGIMYIPFTGELAVFSAAFIGACVGFLWYNSHPAQVFMGDTGSLAIGGIIASLAILVRKELLIPILCGVFLIENLSVMMQVAYFKYTKKKTGVGKRIFLMSPLHHHYQKKGYAESKIVTRFWIAAIFLAILTIITLKIR